MLTPAEVTSFPDNYFDLITVAQAIHWFDFDKFYSEVRRTIKPGGVLAVVGYSLLNFNNELAVIVDNFYKNIVGKYWDKERKYIDENYTTIPFPFDEIKAPNFSINYRWTFEQFIGYLQTWSAVQNYITEHKDDPVLLIRDELKKSWVNKYQTVCFPILLKVARI